MNGTPKKSIPTSTKGSKAYGTASYINGRTITLAAFVILILMNVIAIGSIKQRKFPELLSADQVKAASYIDLEEMFAPPFDDARVYTSDYTVGTLRLINSTYAHSTRGGKDIPDANLVQVNRYIENRNFKARDNTIKLSADVVDALNSMFADFIAAGGTKIVMVNEAYRSYEAQQSILDAKIKQYGANQTIAQKPGYSEHHTGYALDFSIYPDGGKGARTFTREQHNNWIYNNCHKYGFILRYPEGKTDITGISPESWHFRYVGVPHATYMFEMGLTLEEYVSELRIYTESLPLYIVANGEEYGVYYVEKGVLDYTDFKVPKDAKYQISGDNIGGFVVWYKTGVTVAPTEEKTENTEETEAAN